MCRFHKQASPIEVEFDNGLIKGTNYETTLKKNDCIKWILMKVNAKITAKFKHITY